MKNITVSVPDEVYRAARVAAAERGTSVSALVRDYLRSVSDRDGDDAFELARRRRQEIIDGIEYFSASENVPRDELYERGLR